MRTKVFILYTGGTIGMRPQDPSNPASPLRPMNEDGFKEYIGSLCEEKGIDWEIGTLGIEPLDSSDVNSKHWLMMAEVIKKKYDQNDGFVVLHGTDTMAYTTSGLSFILRNLAKPVVVTGSQLPIFHPRTDARLNLANALYIAGYKSTGIPLVPEVVLCFGDVLLRGNRARKISSTDLNGFASPNFPPLGRLGEHIDINSKIVLDPSDNNKFPFSVAKTLNTNVMDIGFFPGFSAKILEKLLLETDELRGVVMRTYGAGNAPQDSALLSVIDKAINPSDNKQGKVILNITQCVSGMVEMGLYENSSGLLDRGVISGLDMTPEAALAKMFWILENEVDPNEIQTQLQINQKGEQSENLFDIRYSVKGSKDKPEECVTLSARPPGLFRKEQLNRAVLRISGFGLYNAVKGDHFKLKVFINMPSANYETSEDDSSCAAVFEGEYQGDEKQTLIKFVTSTISKMYEDGRAINITIVPEKGKKIWYSGLFLSLFAKA